MTVYRVPELWCDGCSERFTGDGDSETAAEIRAEAGDWLHERGRKVRDLCPDCIEFERANAAGEVIIESDSGEPT